MLADGALMPGHAKALLGLDIAEEQTLYARKTIKEGLSVRQLEKQVQALKQLPRKPRVVRDDIPKDHVNYLSEKLHGLFGTSVRLSPCKTYANGKKGKGLIEIDFYSNDELHGILQILGLAEE